MLYAIMGTDVADSLELRKGRRAAHLQRLSELQAQGRLFVAGPHPAVDAADPGPNGFSGSLIIAEFPSLEEARAWAEQDPYATGGVYAEVVVKPFKKTLP
jgi:uncharacterized protein YciI